MRIIWLVLFCLMFNVLHLSAQVRGEAYLPSFFVDIDANGGLLSQKINSVPVSTNYPDNVNGYTGKFSVSNGTSISADIELGYYINRKRTFGVGIGLIYSRQMYTLGLDTFHVEFRSTDYNNNVFRQVISTDHPIAETINRTILNIPFLLRYKKDISGKLFFTADGGVVYNIQSQNTWNTNANFDYEAIYKFTGSGSNIGFEYDNSPVPGSEDLLMTKSQASKGQGTNVANYFSTRNSAGYSVGLNEQVKNKSGNFQFAKGSLGYTVDAALNFRITKKVYFKLGGYYLAQNFNNSSPNNSSLLTSKILRNSAGQDIGVDYNSLNNFVKSTQSTSYGVTLGIKIYLSRNSLLDYE